MRSPAKILTDWMIRTLVKDSRNYTQRFPNDIERLKKLIRPGDVILVEGSQRISEIIKYLTQSSWSHAALFVGDRMLRGSAEDSETLRNLYGDEASAMLVEANVETGVCAVPLSKYTPYNIRICRPIKLRPEDLRIVIEEVVGQIGVAYSVRQTLGLARYFFPVTLIPKRFRRQALEHSGDFSREVICSSQIAMAFQKVRYPILPRIVAEKSELPPRRGLRRILPRRLTASPNLFETGIFAPCDPMLLTPRDFDLSPYFQIIKGHCTAADSFDYKTITWSEQPGEDNGGKLGEQGDGGDEAAA